MRQEIAQELELVKDIGNTLTSLKVDSSKPSRDDGPRYEEPTRDPDVWPPPTPVEYKLVDSICVYFLVHFSFVDELVIFAFRNDNLFEIRFHLKLDTTFVAFVVYLCCIIKYF